MGLNPGKFSAAECAAFLERREALAESSLVFVYGSLKSGFHNHRLLIDHKATPYGHALTDMRYLLLKGGAFPYLIDPAALDEIGKLATMSVRGHVSGELYRMDDAGLVALDSLESHPHFYRREVITVNHDVKAWAYFLTEADKRLSEHDGLEVLSWAMPDETCVVEWRRADVFADED